MTKRKRAKDMAELTKGYEELVKGKELNPDSGKLFSETIKKAAIKPKRAKK